MSYYIPPVKIAVIKKITIASVGEEVGTGNLCALLMGMQTSAATMENNYHPIIPPVSIYPEEYIEE